MEQVTGTETSHSIAFALLHNRDISTGMAYTTAFWASVPLHHLFNAPSHYRPHFCNKPLPHCFIVVSPTPRPSVPSRSRRSRRTRQSPTLRESPSACRLRARPAASDRLWSPSPPSRLAPPPSPLLPYYPCSVTAWHPPTHPPTLPNGMTAVRLLATPTLTRRRRYQARHLVYDSQMKCNAVAFLTLKVPSPPIS
jgi:hypothetical protein